MSRDNRTLIIGLAVGGGALAAFLAIACLVGWLVWSKSEAGKEAGRNTVWTRDEFRAAAMGKTEAEIVNTFGRPDGAHDNPDGTAGTWYYHDRVKNPNTGKVDSGILEFVGGRVAEVRW